MESESLTRDVLHMILTLLALIALFIVVVGLGLIAMCSPKDRPEERPPDEDHDRVDD
jgi:hypothetical protein